MATASPRRSSAETRVERGFLIHLVVFLAVNAVLAILNFSRNPENLWFLWVLGGWGLGVLIHAACVYLFPDARERMIDRTRDRMDRRASA